MLTHQIQNLPDRTRQSFLCQRNLYLSIPLFLLTLLSAGSVQATSDDLTLWFDHPGQNWESESLPIGNGALGATIQGGIQQDIIEFSEKTLWTGGPGSVEGYDFGLPDKQAGYPQKFREVQTALLERRSIKPETVAAKLGRNHPGYGSFQAFSEIVLTTDNKGLEQIKNYRRSLDLTSATASVSYMLDGVNYQRDYFVSYPDQVIVIKLSSDQPGKISFSADLRTADNRSQQKSIKDARITLKGALNDNQLKYETQMQLVQQNGTLDLSDDNQLQVSQADSVWLVVSAGTNYANRYPHYRGDDPHQTVSERVNNAVTTGYQQLLKRHLEDYQSLFERVTLNLDQQPSPLPTDTLLAQYRSDKNTAATDRALERLYFQYARYLLISSSRKGSLPANLQGAWNHYQQAPWSADYHVNINLQMNYWLAETTNLSETTSPLFDFIDSLQSPGKLAAQRIFGANGWTMLLNTNIWGFSGLIAWPTAFWQPEAAAWISQHYYQHYLFTGDQDFLLKRAYPIMRGAAQFWLDVLVWDKQIGKWVVAPSYSPEHGDFSVGAAMSQQILLNLFRTTLDAAQQAGDLPMVDKLADKLAELDPGLRIGSWGQLQEWQDDLDDQKSTHRHISHLFALHPSNQISPLETPALANAAVKTLNARGDGGTGWSQAWKINFWARLFDGNRAHKLLAELLDHNSLDNLWSNHPPFQIDGNFGSAAGIAEMLLQSQNHEIHLLPALPEAWPKGAVSGLKARGNVTVDITWQTGKLVEAKVQPMQSGQLRVRSNSFTQHSKVTTEQGQRITARLEDELITFKAEANQRYRITR
ncbi:glycosyl hydrolase family 95 catalytic domain-containing protein [Neptunicella sp. SCSIO 80796]|uniref:glycoside hydrolase family 95 protein n=1 Tax=Neptunicella plasticusilytica TaxID=3117012 RepID=UPI003A4D4C93